MLAPLVPLASPPDRANAQKADEKAKTPEAQFRAAFADEIKRLDNGDTRGFLARQARRTQRAARDQRETDGLRQRYGNNPAESGRNADKKDVDGFLKTFFPAGELRHPDTDSRRWHSD